MYRNGEILNELSMDFLQEAEESETLGKVTILGCYSTFPNGRIEINHFEHLCYIRIPEIYPINLNQMQIHQDQAFGNELTTPSPIDKLLKFLVESNQRLGVGDIVTSINCLGKLLATPYHIGTRAQDWTMHAMKFKGKLFFINWLILGQGRWAIKSKNPDKSQKLTSNFYNFFKCCCTKGDTCMSPSHLSPEHGLSCVFRRKIGSLSIVYSGYVHMAEEGNVCSNIEEMQNLNFVSAKVSSGKDANIHSRNRFLRYNFEFKLSNVQKFALAKPSKANNINNPPQMIEVSDLQKICNYTWNESVCVKFLDNFLTQVQDLMANVDSLHVVYEFQFKSFQGSIKYRILDGERFKTNILSQAYIDFENSLM